jgi:hypothetical protein
MTIEAMRGLGSQLDLKAYELEEYAIHTSIQKGGLSCIPDDS